MSKDPTSSALSACCGSYFTGQQVSSCCRSPFFTGQQVSSCCRSPFHRIVYDNDYEKTCSKCDEKCDKRYDYNVLACGKCNKPCTLSAGGGKSSDSGSLQPSPAVLSTDPKPTISGEEVECASSLEQVLCEQIATLKAQKKRGQEIYEESRMEVMALQAKNAELEAEQILIMKQQTETNVRYLEETKKRDTRIAELEGKVREARSAEAEIERLRGLIKKIRNSDIDDLKTFNDFVMRIALEALSPSNEQV